MKIALVHDGIFTRGGAERVLLNFHKAFPDAPIYTSMYDPDNSYSEFLNCDIRTSWFQKIAKNEDQFKKRFYPFCIFAMHSLDLSEYEVILITSTNCAKYVRVCPKALMITYCFTPFRLAWNPGSYKIYEKSKGIKRTLLNLIIQRLKKIDYQHAQRTDIFIAMTKETSERIKENYKYYKKIHIMPPSIDCSKYYISNDIDDYYLVVSRLERYKKVDLVINTFNKINRKLIIVGRGVEKEFLKSISNANITFLEGIEDKGLSKLYSKCKALIFPQHEDYGLTPLEANASGRPVIAYHKGGIVETMKPVITDSKKSTAIFFSDHTVESLTDAIMKFEKLEFDSQYIRRYAEKFDNRIFIKTVRNFVKSSDVSAHLISPLHAHIGSPFHSHNSEKRGGKYIYFWFIRFLSTFS